MGRYQITPVHLLTKLSGWQQVHLHRSHGLEHVWLLTSRSRLQFMTSSEPGDKSHQEEITFKQEYEDLKYNWVSDKICFLTKTSKNLKKKAEACFGSALFTQPRLRFKCSLKICLMLIGAVSVTERAGTLPASVTARVVAKTSCRTPKTQVPTSRLTTHQTLLRKKSVLRSTRWVFMISSRGLEHNES